MKIGKKLKEIRKSKKMTLKELSDKSGVQIATLSRMENAIMTGTLESHTAICNALGVSLAEFYGEVEASEKNISVEKRSDKSVSAVHTTKSVTKELLVSELGKKKMSPILVRLHKSAHTATEKDAIGSEKFIYVLEGKLDAEVGSEKYALSAGDTLYFDASLPHIFRSANHSGAAFISVLNDCGIK